MKRLLTLALALLIAGCYAELDWREVQPPGGQFTVLMPGKPADASRDIVLGGVKTRMEMLSVQVSGLAYGAGFAAVPDGDPRAVLAGAQEALLRNIGAAARPSHEVAIRGAKQAGIEFSAEGSSGGTAMVLSARMVVTDGRFFQVVFIGRKDRAEKGDVALFLESLKILQ